ncbi:MAG: iron chelate uptake ABC transporter family permease subunit [Muribaculaceae bacterium]
MNDAKGNNRRFAAVMWLLTAALLLLAVADVLTGAVAIPAREVLSILMGNESDNYAWQVIVMESRLPLIATAALSGAALAVSGLLLQTAFNNPLAGPSILGVSTGASLGVAVVMLAFGGYLGTLFGTTMGGYVSILTGAFLGAAVILVALLLFSGLVKGATMLLIVGIMVSYLASSAISLLNFFSTESGVHSYVIWGLGNFSGVTTSQLPVFAAIVAGGLVWAALMVKPLNAMLLGARYAENLGVNMRGVRNQLLIVTGVLTAVVTAFCGPIGFIGLVVPHIARLLLRTSNHNYLLPATVVAGADIALLCTLISVLPTSAGVMPINAITPIIGVPIILYIILNRKKILYFN